MKKKVIPIAPPAPECPVCTTPHRCGTANWKTLKGPNCVGKPNGPDNCDCLNSCGDDPWVHDGRAKPCKTLVAERAAVAKAKETAANLRKFLDAAAGKGFVLDGVDAADLFVALYGTPEKAPT